MKIEIPSNCPICNSELSLVNEQLFCRNSNCSAQTLKNILHFVKTMKIMGLGEKTLEKLTVESISDLYTWDLQYYINIVGDKIGTKIFNEIEKSKSTSISKFINSMGIALIGKTASDKIQSVIKSIDEITVDKCKEAGLGAKATENLVNWVANDFYKYKDLPFNFETTEPVQSGKTVCISGKVPGYTKASIKELLLDYNIHVKDNVSKDIDYLISEETGTTKVKKAESYNIPVVTLNNFMEIIKNEPSKME